MRRLASFGLLAAVALSLLASGGDARAVEPVAQGWWTVTEPGATPGGAAVDRSVLAFGVPEDGLLVEGGPSGPTALAALRYDIAPNVVAETLRLDVADGGGTVSGSVVIACPLTTPFTPAQGGSMASAPSYDCSSVVAGEIDGASYTFDVGPLLREGQLAIALLPAAPSDRVAFARPRAESLTVSRRPTAEVADNPAPASAPPARGETPTAAPINLAMPPLRPPIAAVEPDVGAAPAAVLDAATDTFAQAPAVLDEVVNAGGRTVREIPLPVLAGGALLAVALWFGPTRAVPEFEGGADSADGDAA